MLQGYSTADLVEAPLDGVGLQMATAGALAVSARFCSNKLLAGLPAGDGVAIDAGFLQLHE